MNRRKFLAGIGAVATGLALSCAKKDKKIPDDKFETQEYDKEKNKTEIKPRPSIINEYDMEVVDNSIWDLLEKSGYFEKDYYSPVQNCVIIPNETNIQWEWIELPIKNNVIKLKD